MWLIVLEALAALALLLFLVWWTMFSGRRRGERAGAEGDPEVTSLTTQAGSGAAADGAAARPAPGSAAGRSDPPA